MNRPPVMKTVRKPGTALRASFAFLLLNLPLIFTCYVVYYLAGGAGAEWWIRGLVAIGVAVAQFAIVTNTLAPPLYGWIKSETKGTAIRATFAFFLLNLPLIVTSYAVYVLAGAGGAEWWVRMIMAIGIAIAELIIVTTTVAPPLLSWIKSEETIPENSKPSWEK